ncbi:MAG: hypothetical protein AAF234_11635 [Pseudomonadota bacterium]
MDEATVNSTALLEELNSLSNDKVPYIRRYGNFDSAPITFHRPLHLPLDIANFVPNSTENLEYSVGFGRNSINGNHTASAIEDVEPVIVSKVTTTAEIRKISTYEELFREMKVSVSANFPLWSGYGDAKVEFVRTIEFNSTSVYMLVKIVQTLETVRLRFPKLTNDAKKILFDKGEKDFIRTFGDEYINAVDIGGEFFAVVEFYSQNLSDKTYINGELDLIAGPVALNATLEQKINKTSNFETVKIDMYRSGSVEKLPDHEHVIEYALNFPTEISQSGGTEINQVYAPYEGVINDSSISTPNLNKQMIFVRELVILSDRVHSLKNNYLYINSGQVWQFFVYRHGVVAPPPPVYKGGSPIKYLQEYIKWQIRYSKIISEDRIKQRREFIESNERKIRICEEYIRKIDDVAVILQSDPLAAIPDIPKLDFEVLEPVPEIIPGLEFPLEVSNDGNPLTRFRVAFAYPTQGLLIKYQFHYWHRYNGSGFKPHSHGEDGPVHSAGEQTSYGRGVMGVRFWLEGPRAAEHNISYSIQLTDGASEFGQNRDNVGRWDNSPIQLPLISSISVTVRAKS